jgi:hypothetical protein
MLTWSHGFVMGTDIFIPIGMVVDEAMVVDVVMVIGMSVGIDMDIDDIPTLTSMSTVEGGAAAR